MSRDDYQSIPLIWLILIAILAVMFTCSIVEADTRYDDITQSNDQNLQTTGNVSYDSLGLGLSGADVDINQCYRSYSYFILWQDTKPNLLCLARDLMAEGNYAAAAILRCKPWTIRKAYGGKEECIAILSIPPPVRPAPTPVEVAPDRDDDDYRYEQLEQQLVDLQAEQQVQQQVQQQQVQQVQQMPIRISAEIEKQIDAEAAQRRENARFEIAEGKKAREAIEGEH